MDELEQKLVKRIRESEDPNEALRIALDVFSRHIERVKPVA